MSEPTESERLAFVKFARHTALAADKLCGSLLSMSQKLEEAKIIDPSRKTKSERDKKLKNNHSLVSISNEEISKLISQIQDNPDAESIILSLFRDLEPSRVKKLLPNNEQKEKINKE